MNDFELIDGKDLEKVNIGKILTKFFDRGTFAYIAENDENSINAIDNLSIAKKLSEMIILIRLVLGDK